MFLSLAEYNNHENNGKNEQLDVFGNSNHNNQNNETNERNKFESSLLRQIISLCHRGKIPLSGLKLVPEEKTKSKRKRLTVLLCIDIVAICFVSFSKNVSEFFHGIFGKDADLHDSSSVSPSETYHNTVTILQTIPIFIEQFGNCI